MYLLMLLATYVSAIYGYNLSIRPEFDRDVAHKKAAAVVYKFTHQHTAAKKVLVNIQRGKFASLLWMQPDDLVYTKDTNEKNEENIVLEYLQGGEKTEIPLREKGRLGADIVSGENVLSPGRLLLGADMMVSKILCPTEEIDEETVNPKCTSPSADGALTGTCCGRDAPSYLISYRKLDARWLNRLTNSVSTDFMWVFDGQSSRNNVGVITWSDKSNAWEFVGRIRLVAVYRKDREKYLEEHKDLLDVAYPTSLMNRTLWTMPNKVFTKDFFTDSKGTDKNFCQNGCLFKIEMI